MDKPRDIRRAMEDIRKVLGAKKNLTSKEAYSLVGTVLISIVVDNLKAGISFEDASGGWDDLIGHLHNVGLTNIKEYYEREEK